MTCILYKCQEYYILFTLICTSVFPQVILQVINYCKCTFDIRNRSVLNPVLLLLRKEINSLFKAVNFH